MEAIAQGKITIKRKIKGLKIESRRGIQIE